MKILLLGKNGQVGWELQRSLSVLGDLIALDFDTPSPWQADFRRPESLAPMVQAIAPDVIVNAAAHTAVDRAESEPDLACAINATAPGILAREAAARGAWLVHYSTDYVFDGSGSAPRTEDALTGPLSVYGRTKLEGEAAIRAAGGRYLVLRTSWIYSARGNNFARTMLRLAAERDALKVIDDQVGAPTGADLLADVTAHALRRALAEPTLAGTYHCVAGGEVSWHGYARFAIEWARAAGVPIKVAPNAIHAIPTSEYPTPARRPLNSRLDTTLLQRVFDLHLPHWQTGVERLLTELIGR